MQRAFIAGCGYVGIATARLFRDAGWKVTAWTRSGELADRDLAIDCRAVDLREREEVRRNSLPCNVVVHCASSGGGDAEEYRRVYRDGVTNLVAAFPEARILFTSSTSVYEQRDGSWVDENSEADPSSAKGKILRESEEIALASGGIVLRLGGIYGPGRSYLLRSVMDGTASISGEHHRYVNQIHRDDIALAIFFLAQQAGVAAPRIFNVVDDVPSPRREILSWLSTQLRKPLRNFPERIASKRGDSNKRVSNAKLRALGWSPRYPSYQQGFVQLVQSTAASSRAPKAFEGPR
jgi:nucleoside-diphosphate-sugar epimerase